MLTAPRGVDDGLGWRARVRGARDGPGCPEARYPTQPLPIVDDRLISD